MLVKAIRFGVGTEETPLSYTWKLWSNKSDVYLAVRSLGGMYKMSLHGSGVWTSAFTQQSGVAAKSVEGHLPNRRHAKWQRPSEFTHGLTMGPRIVFPWVPWLNELPPSENKKSQTAWFPEPYQDAKRTFFVLFSSTDKYIGDASIVRKGDMFVGDYLKLNNGQYVWLSQERNLWRIRIAAYSEH